MNIGTSAINVINSLTTASSTAARIYSQASSILKLAMASGTYTIQATSLTMNS